MNFIEKRSAYHTNGHGEVLPLYRTFHASFLNINTVQTFYTTYEVLTFFVEVVPLYKAFHALSALSWSQTF